jgi:hypothetical protein
MTKGGDIANETVTPLDDSVGAETVARWLNCSSRVVRHYAEEGLAIRVGPGRFDIERSVGDVVLHLRELASSRRGFVGHVPQQDRRGSSVRPNAPGGRVRR